GAERGSPDLADYHARGVVREHGRLLQRAAGAERERAGGEHGVAGAGHVVHLARHGGELLHPAAPLEEGHDLLAARDEDGRRVPIPSSRGGASRSRRTTCCWWAMMRVFSVVRAWRATTTPSVPAPSARSAEASRFPAASSPTIPHAAARPPSAVTLLTTLPAPPGRSSSPVTCTTGTGASGEMRSTCPHTKRSSIKSPTTSARTREKRPISSASRRP